MVSRGTLTALDFFDLADVWFSSFFDPGQPPWALLAGGKKEELIVSAMAPNVGHVPRNGPLVKETTRVETSTGVCTIEAGSFLADERIEVRGGFISRPVPGWRADDPGPRHESPPRRLPPRRDRDGPRCPPRPRHGGQELDLSQRCKAPHFAYVATPSWGTT